MRAIGLLCGISLAAFQGGVAFAQTPQPPINELAETPDPEPTGNRRASKGPAVVEEVIVTGTRIRGIRDLSSPVTAYGSESISQRGVGTTEDFLRTIPQNFSGGFNSSAGGAVYGGEGSGNNFTGVAGINLRGLGNSATLVLMDNHRIAGSGYVNVSDISLIPLFAIERIDVLTDGASAVYGTDAIGGVVNFLLKKNFDGAKTSLRFGTVTTGGRREYQVDQLVGHRWDSGWVSAAFNLTNRTSLSSVDRKFAQNLRGPDDLLPDERKRSGLVSLGQELSPDVTVTADILYGARTTELNYLERTGRQAHDVKEARQLDVNLGATIRLSNSWQAELGATYDGNRAQARLFQDGVENVHADFRNRLIVARATANGNFIQLPAGMAKIALGGEFRGERYDSRGNSLNIPAPASRRLFAVFGEAQLPILGDIDGADSQGLMLSLAGRYEHSSDFGATTNPKIGLSWRIDPSLRLRGTFGTSFRAPTLSELDVSAIQVAFPFPVADPQSPTGRNNALFLYGGSDRLGPETARQWTLGVDYEPRFLPGLKASASYFSTRYKNLISQPLGSLSNVTDVLQQESVFADYVLRNPSAEMLASIYANPRFQNPFNIPASDVGVFVDNRLVNIASREQQGLDFNVHYETKTAIGTVGFDLAGTRLLKFADRAMTSGPAIDILNTVFHPAKLKARAEMQWSNESWSAGFALNYVGSYINNTATPKTKIRAWTTADARVSYILPQSGKDTPIQLSFSVLNMFDKDPPFISVTALTDVNFDATNANALGRFVAFQISKSW